MKTDIKNAPADEIGEVDKKEGYIKLTHEFFDEWESEDVSKSYHFKRPTPQAAERAQKQLLKKPGQGFRNLCVSCIHPEQKDDMLESFKEYPGLATTFGGALLKASGYGDLGN